MISSVTPAASTPKTVNDMPDWGPVALAEISQLSNLLIAISNEPGQSISNEKALLGLMAQLPSLATQVAEGKISESDFQNQIDSIATQAEQLQPPSSEK